MFINKIGSRHLKNGTNCQDFGFIKDNRKVVVDGCSGTPHSEVGAKLFCFLLQNGETIESAFKQLTALFTNEKSLMEHCCFTYFEVIEFDECWQVQYCGDGYIIKQWLDETISFDEVYNGTFPEYYVYNYINPEHRGMYKDGISIKTATFSKKLYKNIGIATDGVDYIMENELDEEFEKILLENNELWMNNFINKHNGLSLFNLLNNTDSLDDVNSLNDLYELVSMQLKDDITIVF